MDSQDQVYTPLKVPASVLEGDDGVDPVDVVGAVPEDPGEVVGVGRVVHLDLLTEATVFGGGDLLSSVVDHLEEKEDSGSDP